MGKQKIKRFTEKDDNKNNERKKNNTFRFLFYMFFIIFIIFLGVIYFDLQKPQDERMEITKKIVEIVPQLETAVPTVQETSINFETKKISSNAPIKISFNQEMDEASVKNAFEIKPKIDGDLKIEGKDLIFNPKEDFPIGENFTVIIKKSAKNKLDKNLAMDFISAFTIVENLKVLLNLPQDTADENDRITVAFDRPVIPMKIASEIKREDFPIEIKPEIKGKFRWVGTSAVHFK